MSDCNRKDVAVLGFGNPLMSDEGVGTAVIERLLKHSEKYPFADFIDAGTPGMSLLHLLAGRRKVIMIDCATMGVKAGTIKRFRPDEVKSMKKLPQQSLHEADLLKLIKLAEQLGQSPDEIVIFGIEPQTTEPGQKLSRSVTARMNDYIAAVRKELACSMPSASSDNQSKNK